MNQQNLNKYPVNLREKSRFFVPLEPPKTTNLPQLTQTGTKTPPNPSHSGSGPHHHPPAPRPDPGTCGDASPGARAPPAGLPEPEAPLSSSSLSESDPHVESHSSTVLGSFRRQLPNRLPIGDQAAAAVLHSPASARTKLRVPAAPRGRALR